MTLYEGILLLGARWRWLVGLPALALVLTAAFVVVAPGDYEARVRIRVLTPPAPLLAALRSRTFAQRLGTPGRLLAQAQREDAQVIDVIARAPTRSIALKTIDRALAALDADERARVQNVMSRRAAIMARPRDRFGVIEFEALTRQLESVHATNGRAIEVLDPPEARSMMTPYPFLAAGVSALLVSLGSVFVAAWWHAERAARRVA